MSRSASLATAARTPAAILAALGWLATGLVLASYRPGFAIGTLFVGLLLWILDARISAIAMTQVGAAIVAPTVPLAVIALFELGPALLVLAVLAEQGLSIRTTLVTASFTALFGGTTLAAFVWGESLLVATGVLLLVAALSSYTIHRYELVTLGLVKGETT